MNDKRTEGERFRSILNNQGSNRAILTVPYDDLHPHEREWHENIAAEFAEPYKKRIVELEAKVAKLAAWERYEGIVNTRVTKLEEEVSEAWRLAADAKATVGRFAKRMAMLEAAIAGDQCGLK